MFKFSKIWKVFNLYNFGQDLLQKREEKNEYQHTDKVLYIGAGTDLEPVNYFKNINYFIYVDSQPYSEFGKLLSHLEDEEGNDLFYRKNFIDILEDVMKKNNFVLLSANKDIRYYTRNKQTIKYYINTSLPEDIDKISSDINNYNYLILKGHITHYNILNYSNKVTLIGDTETCFNDESDFTLVNSKNVVVLPHKVMCINNTIKCYDNESIQHEENNNIIQKLYNEIDTGSYTFNKKIKKFIYINFSTKSENHFFYMKDFKEWYNNKIKDEYNPEFYEN